MTTFSDSFTQGGQTQLHKLRMLSQVMGATFKASLWVAILAFALLVYFEHSGREFWLVAAYVKAYFMSHCPDFIANLSPTSILYAHDGRPHSFPNTTIAHSGYVIAQANYLLFSCIKKLLQGFLLGITCSGLLSWFWQKGARQTTN